MSNPFAITAATNSVHLSANRRGEASFTVFNSSGRPIRGRARLVPDDPAAAAWLTLEGDAERDLAIAGTEQYTVRIAVPPDAPAGSYPFRLDAVGVENPDEDYTAGPTVTFVVPEPEPQKRPFPWWILLVVGGLLVVCCLMVCCLAVLLVRPWQSSSVTTDLAADQDRYWPPPNTFYAFPGPDFGHGGELELWWAPGDGDPGVIHPEGPGLVVIRFDLASIPSGATIERAVLHLYLQDGEESGRQVFVQRAISSWGEDGPANQPGCDPADQAATAVGTSARWYTWDVTAIVKKQHAATVLGGPINNGLCLSLSDVGRRTFISREGASNRRPRLRITYRP